MPFDSKMPIPICHRQQRPYRLQEIATGVDRYNSYLPLHGLAELWHAIAARYKADLGLHYDPEGEVLVTCGAGEAMLDVLLCYVNAGDKVLLTNPTYNGMAQRVRLAEGVQMFTDLVEEQGWHLHLAALPAQARGCKVLFFMSPAMPTGTVFSQVETQALADVAQENDALLLFNGSLDKIVYDGRRVIHPATLPGMRERTINIGSVSKNYNMMGWRIGWAAGPRELLKPVHDVHIFNTIMPSRFAEAGATAALAGTQDGVAATVARYERNRDALKTLAVVNHQFTGQPEIVEGQGCLFAPAVMHDARPADKIAVAKRSAHL